jgi:hypothetical protein
MQKWRICERRFHISANLHPAELALLANRNPQLPASYVPALDELSKHQAHLTDMQLL